MTTAPIRVPHNSFLSSGIDSNYDTQQAAALAAGGVDTGLPSVTWKQTTGTGVDYLPTWGGFTNRSEGIHMAPPDYASGDSNQVDLYTADGAIPDSHGVVVELCVKPQPYTLLASGSQGGTTTRTDPVYFYVGIKTDKNMYWQVTSQANGDYQIQMDWGNGLTQIAVIPRTTTATTPDYTYTTDMTEPSMNVEFRLISGRLSIRINDMAHEFNYIVDYPTHTTDPSTVITNMYAGCQGFQAATLYSECIKWQTSGSTTSNIQSAPYSGMTVTGINPQVGPGDSNAFTHTLDTSSVDPVTGQTYTQTDGPDLRYKIDFSGPTDGTYLGQAYSNLTAVVRGYEMNFDPSDDYNPATPIQVFPERIVVNHTFDPQALTIRSTARLYFNNDNGDWGTWMMNTGQVAIQIWAGSNSTESGGYNVIFTGYGHRKGAIESTSGGSTFEMFCEDRMCQLASPRWDLPRMDAWNQFYAASYLMQLGGVSTDDMYFNYLIGSDPFQDLGDQYGNPAPFLGFGDSGSLLNKYANGQLDDLLIKQANPIGYMVFPDVNGKFHFEKFYIPSGVKRTFWDSDWEGALFGDGFTYGVTSSTVSKDNTQVRSDSVLIGINSFSPYWNPIIQRRPTDPNTNPIVFDPTVFNHLGYPNPAVWVDGIFADEQFASNSADYMYTVFSLPGLDVQLPTAWLQQDIYPLDVITYSGDFVTPVTDLPIMVTSVTHDITIARATTNIMARYLPGSPNI